MHAHALPAFPAFRLPQHLSSARITALSGVIALHAVAFALLLMPMRAFDPAPKVSEPLVVFPDRIVRPVVPTPPPPDPRPVPPRTPTRTLAPTPPQPPILVDSGPDIAPPPGPIVDTIDTIVPPVVEPGPIAVERLQYASAPPPPYPPEASRRRIEGTVFLRVLVDVDGTPLEVLVERSSGHRGLDETARKFVLAKWRFRPAMRGDVPVQAVGIVPIRFTVR